MAEQLVPEWIKERKAENELRKAQQEAQIQRDRVLALLIDRDANAFWQELYREFEFNTSALSEIGLCGKTEPGTTYSPKERACRVTVFSPKRFEFQTRTELRHNNGDEEIQGSIINGGTLRLRFCVVDGAHLRVLRDNQPTPLTAKEVAEAIVKRMVDMVGSTS